MRKRRPEAKLFGLPEGQQAELADWLLTGMPYHVAAARVEKEFGVSVGHSAFTSFWEEVCVPLMLGRRSQQRVAAEARAEVVERQPARFSEATLDALQERALQLAHSPLAKAKDVKALFGLVLKAKDQELEERRIRLLEEKAAAADKTKAVVESGLTAEEKMQQIKGIFGMA
jgi:hypothetical protein